MYVYNSMNSTSSRALQPKNPSTPRGSDPLNLKPLVKKNVRRSVTPNPKKSLSKSDFIDSNKDDDMYNNEDRIKVYLRMRPLLQAEESIDYKIQNDTISIRPPSISASSFCMDKSFSFRQIFDESSSQDDIFDTVAHPLLPDFIKGNDVLIFCYGSTNAGKTFTVSGSQDNPGLLQRSLNYIVSKIHEQHENHSMQLYASFFEIYNERIFDLLDIKKNTVATLKLGFNKYGETQVKGATEILVSNFDDVKSVIAKAEAGRHRGCTELNCDSSRSHTIFQLKLKKKNFSSIFSVVDLAGSERLSTMNSTIGSFKEACNINKSMLVLGKCIRKLKEQSFSNGNKINQIPYRESKLTHLFKSFFEPVCRPSKAAMVINISPAIVQADDTIFSLQFAAEASQCSIRQVERPAQVIDDESDADSIEVIEARIEARIREEMEAFLEKKENEYKERLRRINSTCNSISDFEGSYMNQSFISRGSFFSESSQMNEIDNELMDLRHKNAGIANDIALLLSSIQYNKEEILKVQAQNKQLLRKNTLMKASLEEIENKNSQIESQIIREFGSQSTRSLMPKLHQYSYHSSTPTVSIMSKPKEQENIEKVSRRVQLAPSNQ
ncbi:Kinesin motor domain containing protein [Tritrichomonas foetus]|uniref:Kinesin motor domain containing protein n=1 Tax=Tritrichomonas foetus TaxID=1144522 RepID=A0A1J4JRK9_9EUKA|nr:Kinesin motor domain containing protein [Tritrichomonas foetus]|eukprot:OHT01775.1 Kinesin motor domain containing protein [Tritrichomonas foetus]